MDFLRFLTSWVLSSAYVGSVRPIYSRHDPNNERFGDTDSSWTKFYLMVSADCEGKKEKEVIQRWIEVFEPNPGPKQGTHGYWEDLDIKKHPKWERFLRW